MSEDTDTDAGTAPGVLEFHGRRATIGPDGVWRGDEALAEHLNAAHPPPATEAGVPWCIAFAEARDALGATVVQAPEDDRPYPPDTVR